jgi:hypothetical protein
MANRQRIRAVRRVTDLAESLLAILAVAGDELSAIQEESADEAYLGTAQDRLASAKESAKAALAALAQWLEDNDDDAGESVRF